MYWLTLFMYCWMLFIYSLPFPRVWCLIFFIFLFLIFFMECWRHLKYIWLFKEHPRKRIYICLLFRFYVCWNSENNKNSAKLLVEPIARWATDLHKNKVNFSATSADRLLILFCKLKNTYFSQKKNERTKHRKNQIMMKIKCF